MADVNINLGFGEFNKKLRAAIDKGLANKELKRLVEIETIKAIESVVTKNQDLFRPDRGGDGGNDLIGFLGIGEGGRADEDKVQTAWHFLLPKLRGDNKNLKSEFVRKSNKFGNIEYKVDFSKFYAHPKSTYISEKEGEPSIVIEWMRNLMEGVPTTQVRDRPDGVESYAFLPSSRAGRAGFGRMVPVGGIRIPPRQFTFTGRGASQVIGELTSDLIEKLNSPSFRGQITKAMNKAFRN